MKFAHVIAPTFIVLSLSADFACAQGSNQPMLVLGTEIAVRPLAIKFGDDGQMLICVDSEDNKKMALYCQKGYPAKWIEVSDYFKNVYPAHHITGYTLGNSGYDIYLKR